MRLTSLRIENFRSIKNVDALRIEPFQALVGENNAGKSNVLRALECFLSAGTGGVEAGDFCDPSLPIVIEAEFSRLTPSERTRLRSYLIGDRLILQKRLSIEIDDRTDKQRVSAEYHGYKAEPKDWWLSTSKVIEREGRTPKWENIAKQNGILEYVCNAEGKVNKTSYEAGLTRLLAERHDVEFDEPTLGQTQALGLQQNLLGALPELYLLPAITDYSDEIDRRSSSTVFRRLMADLSDRIMRADGRYAEIEQTLTKLRQLLNPAGTGEADERLQALGDVEGALRDTIKKLMPSVAGVQLTVEVEETRDIFSKGVSIKVDDGVLTDVLLKGHGMQRSIVFSLLQMLMKSKRADSEVRPIILCIEEPELYIHPHAQRLIYSVLKQFAGLPGDADTATGTDQVIYTTHSPTFVDVSRYERIGVVCKKPDAGTIVKQCPAGVLGDPIERKAFKLLTCFGLKHNEIFFARSCILVEGPEDEIGIIATARKLGRIIELPDEIGLSIVVTDGKGEMPKFQKILNAFSLDYSVLLELDGKPETDKQNDPIIQNLNGNKVGKVPNKLETFLGLGSHFTDQRHAKTFFSDQNNISPQMEALVTSLLH